MDTINDRLDRWDRDHFFHPSTDVAGHASGTTPNRIVTGGQGVYITDRDGRQSLDAFAGLYCVNVGYGRTEIADAIAEQAAKLPYYHAYVGHGSEPSITLARMIAERAPDGLNHVYFGLGGSDANETNVKLVWYCNNILGRPEKKKIISRWRGYHGSGLMTGSLTGLDLFHNAFDLPLQRILHTDAPYYFRRQDTALSEEAFATQCADSLERLILQEGPDTIAAFIAEPVLGTGGIVPPPAGYWQAIQPILGKHDIVLISDEVITGFGRLGRMWGCEHYGMRPDIMTVAKGLSSGYVPIGASIVSDEVAAVLAGTEFNHGYTYSGHPVACAVALENLRILEEEGIVDHVKNVAAPYLAEQWHSLADHPMVGETRIVGLMASLALVPKKGSRAPFASDAGTVGLMTRERCFANNLIMRHVGDRMIIAPPLVITPAEIDDLIARARKSLDEAYENVKKAGLLVAKPE